MQTRKSLAIALAVSGLSGQAATADPGTWAGPYVGVSAGGGTGAQSQHGGLLLLPLPAGATSVTSIPPTSTYYSDGGYGISGALLGGGVGFNWQQERFVFGIEGDGSWSSISGSGTCGFYSIAPHACGGGIDALGTVRGRVGYDLGNVIGPFGGVLAFVSGGLAIGDVHAWDSLLGASGSQTIAGWTVGGGFEAMIMPHWSVKVEYLHVDLGDHG
ncbi:MAG TPA: outer membrane beta-barrel protein, partial [Methylocystis sp.]